MSRTTPRGLIEARVQADRLLKDLRSADSRAQISANHRFSRFDLSAWGLSTPGKAQKKHAREIVAREWSHLSWNELKAAFDSGERNADLFFSAGLRNFFCAVIHEFFSIEMGNADAPVPTLQDALDNFRQAQYDTLRAWFAPPGLWRSVENNDLPPFDRDAARIELENLTERFGRSFSIFGALIGFGKELPPRDPAVCPCYRVEYDLNFHGGDYSGIGRFVYIPLSQTFDGSDDAIRGAFSAHTGHSPRHIVHFSEDDLYTPAGEPWVGEISVDREVTVQTPPAATVDLEANPKLERLLVPALVYDDNRAFEVDFDASEWFSQASDHEIKALAAVGWGGDYPADAVAEYFEDPIRNPRVHALLTLVRVTEGAGFECYVDEEAAVHWVRLLRPHLIPDLPS